MTHSNNANSGCFPGLLLLLLCSGNLPTHPSDSMTESIGGEFEKQRTEVKDGVLPASEIRPGVVAQLMGLNSLPDSNWVPKKDPQIPFLEANPSISLIICWNLMIGIKLVTAVSERRHSVTFLNRENELLIVYMKDFEGKDNEIGLNMKKFELGFGKIKQGKEKSNNLVKKKENQKKKMKICKMKDEPRREIGKKYLENRKCNGSKDLVSVLPSYKKQSFNKNAKSSQKKKMIKKEVSSGKKPKKKSRTGTGKKNVVIEADCETENWSPSSVLDFSKKTEN